MCSAEVPAYIYFTFTLPALLTLRQAPPVRIRHSRFVMSQIVVRKSARGFGPVFTFLEFFCVNKQPLEERRKHLLCLSKRKP